MRTMSICVLLASALAGCGTIRNLNEERQVYGGVKIDNDIGVKYRARPRDGENDAVNAAMWVATVVDLPFTVVADTLTLPYILYLQDQQTRPPATPPQ